MEHHMDLKENIVDISIMDVSIVDNKLSESAIIIPSNFNSKKIRKKRSYSELNRDIEITLKNLLGDKCKVIGNKNSSFCDFLYKIPIYPNIKNSISSIVIVCNGKAYPLKTKWGNILKNGDTIHIYKKYQKKYDNFNKKDINKKDINKKDINKKDINKKDINKFINNVVLKIIDNINFKNTKKLENTEKLENTKRNIVNSYYIDNNILSYSFIVLLISYIYEILFK